MATVLGSFGASLFEIGKSLKDDVIRAKALGNGVAIAAVSYHLPS